MADSSSGEKVAEATQYVSEKYVCDICGEEHATHREAVKCASDCLSA